MALLQPIATFLWFDHEAREAAEFYCSIFPDSAIHYQRTIHDTPSGDCEIVSFTLNGQPFQAMSAGPLFKFNEAISLMVICRDQAEVDYYWEKLTSGSGEESMCGWLKDKYGLSWQIVPQQMDETFAHGSQEQIQRAMQALYSMRKLNVAVIQTALDEQ